MVKPKKKLDDIVKSDKKISQVSNLVDRCDEEALISFLLNISVPFSNFTFRPPTAISSTNSIIESKNKNIKQLTKIMQSLALLVRTI